jgi:hypothetical protein
VRRFVTGYTQTIEIQDGMLENLAASEFATVSREICPTIPF